MFRLIGVKLPNNSAAQANEATTIATHTHTQTQQQYRGKVANTLSKVLECGLISRQDKRISTTVNDNANGTKKC